MTDNARDFAPRKGESLQAAEARLQKEFGPKGYKVILEGAGSAHSTGPHIHIEATAQSQQLDVPKPWERYGESSPQAPQKRSQAPRPQDTTPAPSRAQRPGNPAPRPNSDPGLISSLETGAGNALHTAWDTVRHPIASAESAGRSAYNVVRHPADTLKNTLEPEAAVGMAALDAISEKTEGKPFAQGPHAKELAAQGKPWVDKPWSQFKKEIREHPIATAATDAAEVRRDSI